MSKIEKTLELNITHELLSLADSFWWYLQPISLKRYWRPHWRFPFIAAPKCFASGLPINLEGKKGGGYDVCIHSPSSFQNANPRLLFLQFKAGVEQQFNSNPKSAFFGDALKPNIHVEFEINNNAKKDQHRLLQDLAKSVGNENAVAYVFPRIVSETQLENNLGRLLSKTSFISISEIDKKAKVNNTTIDDGNSHKFRTCYKDFNKNEINLLLFLLGKLELPGGVIGEIFAIRMYRALQELQKTQLKRFPIFKGHLMDAFIRHSLNIAKHFSIPFSTIINLFKPFQQLSYRLSYIYDYDDMPENIYDVPEDVDQFSLAIFTDIHSSLLKYYLWIEDLRDFNSSEIPLPPSNFTAEFTNNGLRFELPNTTPSDFADISYYLF